MPGGRSQNGNQGRDLNAIEKATVRHICCKQMPFGKVYLPTYLSFLCCSAESGGTIRSTARTDEHPQGPACVSRDQ